MSSYNNNLEGHQTATCFQLEDRIGQECLIKGHLRFVPDHHHHQQQQSSQQSSGRPQPQPAHPTHFSTNSLPNNLSLNMQHATQFTDDLYPLEPLFQQPQPQQQQQQQQQAYSYPQQQQQWVSADFVPVQRQVPSTRGYSYQPYPSSSPRISHYVSPTTASPWDYSILDYSSTSGPYESTFGSLCTDASTMASHGLYAPSAYATAAAAYNYGFYQPQQFQQHQQQPTCIAPEDLFARMPMTPISPASVEDSSSDDRASSPSSADTISSGSETPLSARSSPTRPGLGLQIPTVPSLSLSTSSIAPSWTNSSATASSSSSLPSPVDSLSSSSSHDEPAFVPTASLKKSAAANSTLKAKRATRSAAPEPAWVEAVLAEDAKRLQMDVVGSTIPRPANRPIAFACVFCRHRKIQCIRPKTEVAPGEKPAPCNQCEKRNRCCEYPPAALNPRIGRRTRPAGGKNED